MFLASISLWSLIFFKVFCGLGGTLAGLAGMTPAVMVVLMYKEGTLPAWASFSRKRIRRDESPFVYWLIVFLIFLIIIPLDINIWWMTYKILTV